MYKLVHPFSDGKEIDEIVTKLIPIELPSDDEVNEEAHNYAKKYKAVLPQIAALIYGAQWMRDKIQGNQTIEP